MKNLPSKRESRDSRAREQTCQSKFIVSRILYGRPTRNDFRKTGDLPAMIADLAEHAGRFRTAIKRLQWQKGTRSEDVRRRGIRVRERPMLCRPFGYGRETRAALLAAVRSQRKHPASRYLAGIASPTFGWIFAMGSRVRHCVECPKCCTRYLAGFSPYRNGSYLVPIAKGYWEEWILYCSCGVPPHSSRWNWDELKLYVVNNQAHHRGYGGPEDILCIGMSSRRSG